MGDLARWLRAEPLIVLVHPSASDLYRAVLPEICGPGPVRLVCQCCGADAHSGACERPARDFIGPEPAGEPID